MGVGVCTLLGGCFREEPSQRIYPSPTEIEKAIGRERVYSSDLKECDFSWEVLPPSSGLEVSALTLHSPKTCASPLKVEMSRHETLLKKIERDWRLKLHVEMRIPQGSKLKQQRLKDSFQNKKIRPQIIFY